VHQVDGAKFDIFAAGAVMFSMIEGSFPAHGGLSQITKRCPEALRWVVRRAMTDYDKRYATASELLGDVEFVRAAADPFAVRPVELPSMRGAPFEAPMPKAAPEPVVESVAAAGSPIPPPPFSPIPPLPHREPAGARDGAHRRPKLRVANWWTGQYVVDGATPGVDMTGIAESARQVADRAARLASESVRAAMAGAGFGKGGAHVAPPRTPVQHRGHPAGLTASEQLKSARGRAQAARARARARIQSRRRPGRAEFKAGPNLGVAVSLFIFLGGCLFLGAILIGSGLFSSRAVRLSVGDASMESGPDGLVLAIPTSQASQVRPVSHQGDEELAAELDGRTAVVLRDAIAFAPPVAEVVTGQLDRLRASGMDLCGVDEAGISADEAAERTELAADLRRALGLAAFQTEAAEEDLHLWLSEHPEVDLVVWVGRDPAQDDGAITWVVLSPEVDREVLASAREVLLR
jgi:hypothetical protein